MKGLEIRAVSQDVFETAVSWAKQEGWNPGLDDLSAFFAADPSGFLIGFLDGEPICSISVVRYGATYGFLGFYIVHPDYRNIGAGLAIWNAGMARLEGRVVGLDGVLAQQDNYRKSGFHFDSLNIRFSGIPSMRAPIAKDIEVLPASKVPFAELAQYDEQFFQYDRRAFLQHWTLPPQGVERKSKVTLRDGLITSFGTIRRCISGYKIGPLFAENEDIAAALLVGLIAHLGPKDTVTLDVPETNPAAVKLAKTYGLSQVFETARMYKGPAPKLPLSNVFGITTFELG